MRTPCEHDRLFLRKTIICGFPRVRVRARTAAKSRATAFKASSTGIFPSVVLGMMLRWHCETTQECERPIIRANSRIPAVVSDIRSSSKHKQSRAISPFFSGQTTFSKPITRRPSGLASTRTLGFRLPSTLSGCKPRREGRRPRTRETKRPRQKSQQLADARARRLTPQSTAPKYLPTESVRDNASSEAEGIKGSTFFYILRTSTMPDLSTSRRGIRLILSMEGHSNARSSLGAHPPPARSNGLRNALGPYHFLSFHRLHNQPQALEPQAVREVFGTSRARVNTDCMQSRGASNLRMFTPRRHRIPLHCNGKQRPFCLRVCKLKC